MSKIKEVLNYLRQPVFVENRTSSKIKDKVKAVVAIYFIYLLPFFCSVFLLFVFNKFLVHFYDYSILEQLRYNREELKNTFGIYTFLVIVLIGPFLEEIIFRLPLTLEKSGIALSVALLTYRFTGGHFYNFNFQEVPDYLISIRCH